MIKRSHFFLATALIMTILQSSCGVNAEPFVSRPDTAEDEEIFPLTPTGFDPKYVKTEGVEVIYLAGGCFWGMEKLMQSMAGVVSVVSGYANGRADLEPSYTDVITGETGYRETVRVVYDPKVISLDAILFAYFSVIDPTIENAQGNDRGTQYQTGVYTIDEFSQATVKRIESIERTRHDRFLVEIEPLQRFYDAEEYHQNYLDKNPLGYCHISPDEIKAVGQMVVDPGDYQRPAEDEIKAMLTDQQYLVTQEALSEPAFDNAYWDNNDRGIYVDVVTGEPLFSSSDKFDSGTGWPSFTQAIDENAIRHLVDKGFGMDRIEVRSRAGNSHLGHVFHNDSTSSTGTRYCINSASLRFVPYDEMDSAGYAYMQAYVK